MAASHGGWTEAVFQVSCALHEGRHWLPRARTSLRLLVTLATFGVLGTTLAPSLHKDEAAFPLSLTSRQRDAGTSLERAAAWIRGYTAPDEVIVTDDPIVVYLADRQAPP